MTLIETHPRRAEIETALAKGVSPTVLAERFGVSKWALYRHRQAMPERLVKAIQIQIAPIDIDHEDLKRREAAALITETLHQRSRLHAALGMAYEANDLVTAANFETQLRKNLELTARIVGEIKSGNTVTNVLVAHPEYLRFRDAITQALADHPKARLAVARALAALESDDASSSDAHVIEHEPDRA